MKNKIFKCDFLIVGGGLIGSLAAIALIKKKFKVLVIEKNKSLPDDQRTLAVNANSRDFLKNLGIWEKLKFENEPINKILIKDYINKEDLAFNDLQQSMGSVIFNRSLLKIARDILVQKKIILFGVGYNSFDIKPKSLVNLKNKKFYFNKIIISLGKNYENIDILKKNYFYSHHHAYVGFFNHQKNHNQTAYEIFTPRGPLAVLPSPSLQKKSSTFIYSTKSAMKYNSLVKLINKNFFISHGNINVKRSISTYPIRPHLARPIQKDVLLLGDTAHSIHPVAGQGWNLGIKDIQTLCLNLDEHNIDNKNFDHFYFSNRIIDNSSYLAFTSALNFLYEGQDYLSKPIIKFGFFALNKIPKLKKLFIKQAMGKIKLI
ncbi:FAD-dependent monooxygenase [Alphaproteobacteria bacterium]|nr:FAD-dependent monooxygenase [Alphaproteobacteria bacterium]